MRKLRRILLIDDDEVTCFINQRLLSKMNVAEEILPITDPWQALKFILEHYHHQTGEEKQAADLIFLDIAMPGMNGFEILEDMEALNIDRSRIFIAMLTTSISQEDRERALSFGDKLQAFLTKPLRIEDVENLLKSMEKTLDQLK